MQWAALGNSFKRKRAPPNSNPSQSKTPYVYDDYEATRYNDDDDDDAADYEASRRDADYEASVMLMIIMT